MMHYYLMINNNHLIKIIAFKPFKNKTFKLMKKTIYSNISNKMSHKLIIKDTNHNVTFIFFVIFIMHILIKFTRNKLIQKCFCIVPSK